MLSMHTYIFINIFVTLRVCVWPCSHRKPLCAHLDPQVCARHVIVTLGVLLGLNSRKGEVTDNWSMDFAASAVPVNHNRACSDS